MLGFALLEKTVGVFSRKKSTVLRGHIASDVIENVARDIGKFSILRDLKRIEVRARELPLIVKHLFEMRDVPIAIDRIAMESAAQMIVHSTRRHLAKREQIHFERTLSGFRLRIARIKSR